jgi:hypothetical protein
MYENPAILCLNIERSLEELIIPRNSRIFSVRLKIVLFSYEHLPGQKTLIDIFHFTEWTNAAIYEQSSVFYPDSVTNLQKAMHSAVG